MCESCKEAFMEEGGLEEDDTLLDMVAELGSEIADHICDDPDDCICSCRN